MASGKTVLLGLNRVPLDSVVDRVTVRGPAPPAAIGFPTPNRFCSSLAFRVRGTSVVVIRGCGCGRDGPEMAGPPSGFRTSVSMHIFLLAAVCSSSMSWIIMDDARLVAARLNCRIDTILRLEGGLVGAGGCRRDVAAVLTHR